MAAVTCVELPIADSAGRTNGTLTIRLLPDARPLLPAALLDERSNPTRDEYLEPVQLLEDREYRYEIVLAYEETPVQAEPAELLVRDTAAGLSGRLRPGSHTGRLALHFSTEGNQLGSSCVEVRSRKLGYLDDYRWMLRDIADVMSEVVMERFGPTEQRFAPDYARDAQTLYQRFAFLQNLVAGENFGAAISQVLARPHRGWRTVHEQRAPGRGIPATSRLARQLVRAGPRAPWPEGHLLSLPRALDVEKQEETLDTAPNRFVKFALERWRDVIAEMVAAMKSGVEAGAPVQRGTREGAALLTQLEALLAQPLFREVGELTHFPASDQVIQKREGYRELFRAYVEFEVASKLAWDGGEDVYGAGQRDVATLYEYWAFFQLVAVVGQICETPPDLSSLVAVRRDGLAVNLQRGRDRILLGEVNRLGRPLKVELWFNRIFRRTRSSGGTWSREMRPDYSLRVCPVESEEGRRSSPDDVWLHFDAKYRVEGLADFAGPDGVAPAAGDALGEEQSNDAVAPEAHRDHGQAKGSDLVKMHAYRDAIRRSAGAYVLYPGSGRKDFREYQEILPGLGAFALRPTLSGRAEGDVPLTMFIRGAMDHVASQLTQHGRNRYWERLSFGANEPIARPHDAVSFLAQPAADTLVLLGYVRDAFHLEWIRGHCLYNLRTGGRRGGVGLGSRELAADLVLVYGETLTTAEVWRVAGEPQVLTRDQMKEMGYRSPGGDAYYCLPLEPIEDENWSSRDLAQHIPSARERLGRGRIHGAPVTTNWLELMRVLDELSCRG